MRTRLQQLFSLLITIGFLACKRSTTGPIPNYTLTSPAFSKGADISWLTEMEAAGRKFYNNAGIEQDLMVVLENSGINTIRLRVLVNPSNGRNNTKFMQTNRYVECF